MAILSDLSRREIWAEFMRLNENSVTITKEELRIAFNDIDDWVSSEETNFNNAISQPARSSLSKAQKALILQLVVEKRYLEGV